MSAIPILQVKKTIIKLATVVGVLMAAAIVFWPEEYSVREMIANKYPDKMLPADHDIVPNIVHFIRFGSKSLTFIDAVCILSALKNQNPETLIIHTDDKDFDSVGGKYWEVLKRHPLSKAIRIKYLPMPEKIFQFEFNPSFKLFHASDVERLRVLKKYGGIYLDSDSYIVQNLDVFRRYEMTLGWEPGGGISDQVLIAVKNARFLDVWLDSYHDYRAESWFYNGGELPTELLKKQPHLANAVPRGFAEWQTIPRMLYLENSRTWKYHHAIHLLINHQYILQKNLSDIATYPVEFNETNILNYPAAIRQMAVDVYPYEELDIEVDLKNL